MNNVTKKLAAAGLCILLCTGSIGTAHALGKNENKPEKVEKTVSAAPEKEETEIFKDETVYVLAAADGSVKQIIVSDWLKNTLGIDSIGDISELTDIENVKDDAAFTKGADGTNEWDSDGGDIYYRGNIEKELPVDLKITYTLDGKPVPASEMAGKSGKLTIRFDYENKQYETVKEDGTEKKVYVPFLALTGMLLDNSVFSNVEVKNGKLINDGDITAVVGFAMPGLQNDLEIEKESIDIPDYVEITADVRNFRMTMTVTLATNEIFNSIDTEKFDAANSLTDSVGELTDAMDKLLGGSSELSGGLSTLLTKSGELSDGVSELYSGANTLSGGISSLDNGAEKLKSGAAQLSDGLGQLSGSNAELRGGAKQVFESLLSMATDQIAASGLSIQPLTIENYAQVLNALISSLDETNVYNEALSQVTSAVEGNRTVIEAKVTEAVRGEIESKVTEAVREQVTAEVTAAVRIKVAEQVIPAATGMTKESYDSAVAAGMIDEQTRLSIEGAIDAQMASPETKSTVDATVGAQMGSDTIKATISAKTDEQLADNAIKNTIAQNTQIQIDKLIAENMASDEVQSKLKAASEGAKSVISLKASLDGYNAFYLGLIKYTDGVASAAAGALELKKGSADLAGGSSKLASGAAELCKGILTLKNGTPTLVDGVTKLDEGAKQLADGLKQFNEEGIEKLTGLIGNDLKGIIDRVKEIIGVSKGYRNFSGIGDGTDGKVKFIYRTDEIG